MVGGRKAQAKQEHIVQNTTDLDFRKYLENLANHFHEAISL